MSSRWQAPPKSAPGATQLLASTAAALLLATSSPAVAREPFLSSTGAFGMHSLLAHALHAPPGGKGVLAEEEAQLLKLREEKEGQVRQELARARAELEAQGAETGAGKLCATPFGIDVVGITEAIALTGALVGGTLFCIFVYVCSPLRFLVCAAAADAWVAHSYHSTSHHACTPPGYAARQRKQELERLNEQLRTINLQLRQQARAGTLYAPGLTYVPPGGAAAATDDPAAELSSLAAAVAVAAAPPSPPAPAAEPVPLSSSLYSMDEEMESEEARQCLQALKEGKRFLKAENGSSAMIRFEKALMLAKSLRNQVQERRAMRGLAAASRLAVRVALHECEEKVICKYVSVTFNQSSHRNNTARRSSTWSVFWSSQRKSGTMWAMQTHTAQLQTSTPKLASLRRLHCIMTCTSARWLMGAQCKGVFCCVHAVCTVTVGSFDRAWRCVFWASC